MLQGGVSADPLSVAFNVVAELRDQRFQRSVPDVGNHSVIANALTPENGERAAQWLDSTARNL